MRLRIYGEPGNPAFRASDDRGAFVDFDSFEAVTEAAREAAIECRFSTVVVANGHRLGTHPSPICVRVEVNANGERVEFTAPTVETALAVWNDHAAGIAEWLQEAVRPASGVRIRVYGPVGNQLLPTAIDDVRAYADFDDMDAVPASLLGTGFIYVVGSATPRTTYQLGEYDIRRPATTVVCSHQYCGGGRCTEYVEASVVATGTHVSVRSSNLEFAYSSWGAYMGALSPGSQFAQQAHTDFVKLRQSVNQA